MAWYFGPDIQSAVYSIKNFKKWKVTFHSLKMVAKADLLGLEHALGGVFTIWSVCACKYEIFWEKMISKVAQRMKNQSRCGNLLAKTFH